MRKLLCLIAVMALLLPALGEETEPVAEVLFMNAGKADAAVILTPGSTVVIDTGTNKAGKQLASFLVERGIDRVDVMIITHFDKDHVGGADQVLKALPVALVIEPDYAKESKQRSDYLAALASSPETRIETLAENASFELDGLHYDIDVANAAYYGEDEENDFSLVTRVIAGQVSFLFAGDVESMRMAELLREGSLKSDVLKVPHHGREDKLSDNFFDAVSPSLAVITSDLEDPEDEAVLRLLREIGAEVRLTREGAVCVLTDGKSITVRQGND